MRLCLLALVLAPVLCAQSYTVSEITNEYQTRAYLLNIYGSALHFGDFVDPVNQTPDNDDGVAGPVSLGFLSSFEFFGNSYTECWVGTNGFVTFDVPASAYPAAQATLPDSTGLNNFIAAAWKDMGLQPLTANAQSVLYYTDIGTGLGQWEFMVLWQSWPDSSGSGESYVLLCLYEGSNEVEIHFGSQSGGANFACGIENAAGTQGIACPAGWSGVSAQGKAYRFTPATQPPQQLAITTASQLPPGDEGSAYSHTFTATGGVPPYYWYDGNPTTGANKLPPGWNIDVSTGELACASPIAGTYNFEIYVSDTTATGLVSGSFSVTVNAASVPPPPLVITTTSLPGGMAGVAYSQPVNATGGAGTYSWAVSSGALPGGVSLSSGTPDATIAGTPSAAGTFSFTLEVSDGAATAQQPFSVSVTAPGAGGSGSGTTTSASGGAGCAAGAGGLCLLPLLLLLLRRRKA